MMVFKSFRVRITKGLLLFEIRHALSTIYDFLTLRYKFYGSMVCRLVALIDDVA